jgi:hypothetical protein
MLTASIACINTTSIVDAFRGVAAVLVFDIYATFEKNKW